STVYRLQRERNQRFGAGQSIDILLGKRTDKVSQYGHDSLTVFGIGADLRETEWRAVARQLLAQGLLAVEGDYGALVLTDDSAPVLARQRQVMLRRDPLAATAARRAPASHSTVELSPEAGSLFERLRAWRAATAKEQGVPAYVIFHDATLRQIATRLPGRIDELGTVSGVGVAS